MTRKLMILGASLAQLPGIRAARDMGHMVISCDNQPRSIGHRASDASCLASTFDETAVLTAARDLKVDGIMTLGTDQPVLTATRVASQLGLPSLIDCDTARAVTDKRVMKTKFTALGLPTVPYRIYDGSDLKNDPDDGSQHENGIAGNPIGFKSDLLSSLTYPVVVKPVDSQGQRGVWQLPSPAAVRDRFADVLTYSRAREILVEQYYPNDEVTVSGWVHQGRAHILSITDRISFDDPEQLGICLSHEWPSKHLPTEGNTLADLTQSIVSGFGIENGPIYFQFLIGADGIQINEIACRIGGAFESQYIPRLTGFDPTRTQIELALGLQPDPAIWTRLEQHDFRADHPALSVQLFFAHPCVIAQLTPLTDVLACDGVIDAGYHVSPGQEIRRIDDATARVGYCIVTADSKKQLESRLADLYTVLTVRDPLGHNQLIHRPLEVE